MDKTALEALLLQKRQQLESQLRSLELDEPQLLEHSDEAELIAAASQADRANKMLVEKQSLVEMLGKVNESLVKVENGSYGICEDCSVEIGKERMEAIPTTTHCIRCTS